MLKIAKRAKKHQNKNLNPNPETHKQQFADHLYELRRRLFYVAVSVGVFSIFAYSINRTLVSALLKPAGSTQKFIYTSPIGGIDFLFRVCLYFGIACSIPVIVYQFLRYVEPLFKKTSIRFITWGSIISGILAVAGMIFGYFVGLPATMHFLLHQFVTVQIQPLLTIQSYMSFVTMYMLGSALLFQVPLIMFFINRITPLNPKKLLSMKIERWVILLSFVFGGIMNPNPNLLDQAVIVLPLILMYQVGVFIVWRSNSKNSRPIFVNDLAQKDNEIQSIRLERFKEAHQAWMQTPESSKPLSEPVETPTVQSNAALEQTTTSQPVQPAQPARTIQRQQPATNRTVQRPMKYFNDFRPITQRQPGEA